jgi:D-arabinose 1-dehydrogenase-like Zn-dependent alcohol dehydrogenase
MFGAAQASSPGAELALVDRTLADPGPATVRVAVEACGICHSDSLQLPIVASTPGTVAERSKN